MEIQIMSRDTVKPCWPTPHHLKSYKLCLLDQLVPRYYIPIVLFYSASSRHGNPINSTSDSLKKSLSQALAHFYPLAGRLKDDLTIDCNDGGATFIEAQVGCNISSVVGDLSNDRYLQQLLPFDPLLQQIQSGVDQELLGVQVNYFACGGMAISICISHIIADASAASNFLKTWAALSASTDQNHNNSSEQIAIQDCSSLFPPADDVSNYYRLLEVLEHNNDVQSQSQSQSPEDEVVTQMFLFDASKIAVLRNEIRDELDSGWTPTRVEAVTALIWEALVAATAENVGISPILGASTAVNMRKRMNPPLPPQQCNIGNVCAAAAVVNGLDIKEIQNSTIGSLARRIHEAVKEIDDGFIRKMFMAADGGACLNQVIAKASEDLEQNSKTGVFFFSSWCRFPFYETDFGWGKPKWLRNGLRMNRNGFFHDTSDDEGIEAWISLTKPEMAKLEQQPRLLALASFKPNI